MEEDTKEIGVFFILAIIFIIGIGWIISADNKSREKNRIKNIQEINECIEKTNDFNWCMDKFLK